MVLRLWCALESSKQSTGCPPWFSWYGVRPRNKHSQDVFPFLSNSGTYFTCFFLFSKKRSKSCLMGYLLFLHPELEQWVATSLKNSRRFWSWWLNWLCHFSSWGLNFFVFFFCHTWPQINKNTDLISYSSILSCSISPVVLVTFSLDFGLGHVTCFDELWVEW